MAAFVPTLNPRPTLGIGQGPDEVVLVSNAAYTATASQEFAIIGDAEAIEVTISFTKVGAAPSVVFSIEAFDVAKNGWVTLLTGAAVAATADSLLLIGKSTPNVANVSAAHNVRGHMRVTATHTGTDVANYSLSVASV